MAHNVNYTHKQVFFLINQRKWFYSNVLIKVGDLDQGLSYTYNITELTNDDLMNGHISYVKKFARLAHINPSRFDGVFIQAKEIYKISGLSCEGHRNYPLRETKCLRRYKELQLPFSPWLEQWGR